MGFYMEIHIEAIGWSRWVYTPARSRFPPDAGGDRLRAAPHGCRAPSRPRHMV